MTHSWDNDKPRRLLGEIESPEFMGRPAVLFSDASGLRTRLGLFAMGRQRKLVPPVL